MAKPIDATPKSPWFSHAGKLVVTVATTGAALVHIFNALYSHGVIGKSETRQSIGDLGAAWVGLRPAFDTATAIGDTIHLAAMITDKSGSILVGARPSWTSDDPNVAMVLTDGSVVARGPGATTITVAAGSVTARSRIVVAQRVATLSILPVVGDSSIAVAEGDRRTLRARAFDARGYVIAGITPQWHIDDSSVAALDTAGALTGENAGRTIVSASINGISARAAVTVIPTPTGIAAVAGASQRALAGGTLPQPVVVRVTGRKGRPVAGQVVTFRPDEGHGSAEPATARTDADGRARTTWTLGDLPGRQLLLSSVERVDSALAIVAEADPVASNTRVAPLAERLSGIAGQLLADSVGVRLTDSTGRALADVPVTWTALDGGAVEAIAMRTDSLGEARVRWTLGKKAGAQRLRAQVGAAHGVAPVTIAASALAGEPVGLVVISGDEQRAAVGMPLTMPLVVRVVDASGNGVAGVTLVLSPSAGTVPDTTLHTDSLGVARIHWTMGRSALPHTLAVHVDGLKQLIKLSARATPAAPANLSFDDAPLSEAKSADGKRKQLHALVTDIYGNPVPDVPVSFSTRSGGVTPARAVSDAKGRVPLTWTLGTTPGEHTLVGSVRGANVSGTYVTHVTAREASAGARAAAKSAPTKPATATPGRKGGS